MGGGGGGAGDNKETMCGLAGVTISCFLYEHCKKHDLQGNDVITVSLATHPHRLVALGVGVSVCLCVCACQRDRERVREK